MEDFPGVAISGGFFILPLLYMLVVSAVVVVGVVAAWRIMKAQEATAAALQQIAETFRSRPS